MQSNILIAEHLGWALQLVSVPHSKLWMAMLMSSDKCVIHAWCPRHYQKLCTTDADWPSFRPNMDLFWNISIFTFFQYFKLHLNYSLGLLFYSLVTESFTQLLQWGLLARFKYNQGLNLLLEVLFGLAADQKLRPLWWRSRSCLCKCGVGSACKVSHGLDEYI